MSAGIAACRFEMDSQDQLISRADTALYNAKRSGRNRVCCDEDRADSGSETNSAVDVFRRSPPGDSNE